MQVARDLIRDLVGILFPGGLIVIFTLWAYWAIETAFDSSTPFSIFSTDNSFVALILISYVIGQSLRMKRLTALEKKCTHVYRKKKLPGLTQADWSEFVKEIEDEERLYFDGKSSLDKLRAVYKRYYEKFDFWEQFPYAYRLIARRLLQQSDDYIKFFEKYDKQGLTKTETFFNFCKSVIYEFSSSFKEEILRQESLVRLFAGIYYVIKYGKGVAFCVGVLHLGVIIAYYSGRALFFSSNYEASTKILLTCTFAFSVFIYMNKEILQRLRNMRVKEINLAHDGFYLVCKKHNLEL